MNIYHIPVMPKETLQFLKIKKASWYIDCTLGGGGHTEEIIKAGGKVLGLDLDKDAIKEVAKKYDLTLENIDGHLQAKSDNLILYQTNFAKLKGVKEKLVTEPIMGILFDLGISSHQLEQTERGFSFNKDAPLDMRMNPEVGIPASDLINGLYEGELANLFWKLGEERYSKRIAKKIVEKRQKDPIQTTNQLVQIILSVRPRTSKDRIHPATKIFQALRIAVNDELNSLKEVLPQALQVLSPEGRLVVISFHSLEDRIVKDFFKDEEKNSSIKILTQKPVTPSEEEIDFNPRARSGKLRAVEKLLY